MANWLDEARRYELSPHAAVVLAAILTGLGAAPIGGWFGWTFANQQKPALVRTAAADERTGSVRLAVEGVSIWVKAPQGSGVYDVSTDGATFYRVGPEGRMLESDPSQP